MESRQKLIACPEERYDYEAAHKFIATMTILLSTSKKQILMYDTGQPAI